MPRRKSDATEGEAPVPEADASAGKPGPDESVADASPELSTPDEAAEPGSPDPTEPPAEPADPAEAIEPYREAEIVAPEAEAVVPEADAQPEPADVDEPAYPYREPEIAEAAADAQPEPAAVVDEPRAAVTEVIEEPHEQEEEAGSSFASKVLMGLLLLLVGGGLALWGAPKLAPHLPSGMSGVADWLTPGARDAEARIAALEARLDESVGGIEGRLEGFASADDVDARVSSAVGQAVDTTATRLDGEIATLRESVAQLGTGDLPQQLARLQSAFEGQGAELSTLKDQLSGAEAATGTLTEEAVARIDVYRAELDGLRAEVGTLQDRVAGLATRLDQTVQGAEREIETARTQVEEIRTQADTRLSAAEAETNLALIRAAIESGAPFEAPVAALEERGGVTVPQGLAAAAPTGVATMARLRDEFSDSAHAAIRSSIMASAGDGVLARTRAFFGAQVASRSLAPQEGDSPDAVLSRVEDHLRQGDLDAALAEAGKLTSEAQAAMAAWLAAARLRAGAIDGLAALESAPPATN